MDAMASAMERDRGWRIKIIPAGTAIRTASNIEMATRATCSRVAARISTRWLEKKCQAFMRWLHRRFQLRRQIRGLEGFATAGILREVCRPRFAHYQAALR